MKLNKLVLASGNAGKSREFATLLAPLGVEVVSQAELGIEPAPEPFETFVENALAKARHASRESGLPALADDSGLCVDALSGAPGVHSARYAPDVAEGMSQDAANNALLVQQLQGETRRGASFVAVLVLVRHPQDPLPLIGQAVWRGEIVDQASGEHGFGYDPHFWLPELEMTAAQLAPEQKNAMSHRAMATRKLIEALIAADLVESCTQEVEP